MVCPPFLDCPERTQFSDEYYGVLGRALLVCQQFETKCRCLAMIYTMKRFRDAGEGYEAADPKFAEFVSDLCKRQLATNVKVLKYYGLNSQAGMVLGSARVARNEIVHGIALGAQDGIETDTGRTACIKSVAKCVRAIAVGDRLISVLLQMGTHEPVPNSTYLRGYPASVVEWVCGTGAGRE